ncbi:MAG: site-2 protease family protein [Actinomycetota bacterium]|nr:site-2 protease family protein [Actinomycetota bacterium]
MFKSSIKIFTIFGIEIRLDYSWFIIFALFAYYFGFQYFPQVLPGLNPGLMALVTLITVILFFFSVLFHEMSHSLVARKQGIPVNRISLFIFGGMAQIEKEADNPGSEFVMAVAGPLASFFLALVFGMGWLAARGTAVAVEPLRYLTIINIMLGAFNLLPGFPLDGGRVLRSIIWKTTGNLNRATYIAMISGRVIGFLMVAVGILFIFIGNFLGGVWLAFIGWFLQSSAYNSYRQTVFESAAKGVKVADVMNENIITVPRTITLEELIDNYFMKYNYGRFPVVEGKRNHRFIGVISLHDVKSFSQEERISTMVGEVVKTFSPQEVINPDMEISEAIKLMSSHDLGHLVIMDGEKVKGIITRSDVMRFIKLQSELH